MKVKEIVAAMAAQDPGWTLTECIVCGLPADPKTRSIWRTSVRIGPDEMYLVAWCEEPDCIADMKISENIINIHAALAQDQA